MTLTTAQRAETMLLSSDQAAIVLLTIDHTDLSQPIRLCSAPTVTITSDPAVYGVLSNSELFYFLPFELTSPEESERPGGRATLTIPHFTPDGALDLAETFRGFTGRPTCAAQVVMTPDVDTPVLEFSEWEIVNSRVDAENITLDMRADGLTVEPAPTGTYDSRQFPGLYP